MVTILEQCGIHSDIIERERERKKEEEATEKRIILSKYAS